MRLCANCGSQLREDEDVCQACGAMVQTVMEDSTSQPTSELERNKGRVIEKESIFFRNRKNWKIIIVIFALLIGGIATALLLKNSPKELFFIAEAKAYKAGMEEWKAKYGDYVEYQKMVTESPSQSKIAIKGNIELPDNAIGTDLLFLQKMIEQMSIELTTKMIPEDQTSNQHIALQMNGINLVDMEYVQTKDTFGVKIPFMYSDYLYLNNDDFGNFIRKFDPSYKGPDTLDIPNYKWSDFELTEEEKDHLASHYKQFLIDELKSESFSLDKGVSFEHAGEKLKLNKITLKLSSEETEQIIKDLFDYMAKDEKFHEIIAKRIAKIAETNRASFDAQLDVDFTKPDNVQAEFKKLLEDARENADQIKVCEGLKYTIFIDKSDKIINRNISIGLEGAEGDLTFVFETKNVPLDNNKLAEEVKITVTPEEKEQGFIRFVYGNKISDKKDKRIEDATITLNLEEYGETLVDGKLTLHSKYEGKEATKQNVKRDFKLAFNGDGLNEDFQLTGSINEERDLNVNKKYGNNTFDIKVDFGNSFNEPFTAELNIDSKTEVKDKTDIEIPTITDGVNIAELSENELYSLLVEIESNIQNYLSQFQSDLFGF